MNLLKWDSFSVVEMKEWKGFSRNIKARIAISTISALIPLCAASQSYKKNNGERVGVILEVSLEKV